MNTTCKTILGITILLICSAPQAGAQQIETHFSPKGDTASAIAAKLDAATKTIDIAAYELTQEALAEHVTAASNRGVTVRIILDSRQESTTTRYPNKLQGGGIALRTDAAEKLHHNKYAIIDATIVVTGSYNWSTNAETTNAENCIIITDKTTAAAYAANFQTHWEHSRAYSHRTPKRKTIQPLPPSPSPQPTAPTTKGT